MPLVNLVVALIIVGLALWMINRFIPMAASIKTILNVVVVVAGVVVPGTVVDGVVVVVVWLREKVTGSESPV